MKPGVPLAVRAWVAFAVIVWLLVATIIRSPTSRPAPATPTASFPAVTGDERASRMASGTPERTGVPVPPLGSAAGIPSTVPAASPTTLLGDVSWAWSPGYTPATPTPAPPAPRVEPPYPIHGVTGRASYYDDGPGLYAALPGPWSRGRWITVCATTDRTRCASAPVITSCGCHTNEASAKIVDLSPDLMRAITGWERWQLPVYGVVQVVMEVLT